MRAGKILIGMLISSLIIMVLAGHVEYSKALYFAKSNKKYPVREISGSLPSVKLLFCDEIAVTCTFIAHKFPFFCLSFLPPQLLCLRSSVISLNNYKLHESTML